MNQLEKLWLLRCETLNLLIGFVTTCEDVARIHTDPNPIVVERGYEIYKLLLAEQCLCSLARRGLQENGTLLCSVLKSSQKVLTHCLNRNDLVALHVFPYMNHDTQHSCCCCNAQIAAEKCTERICTVLLQTEINELWTVNLDLCARLLQLRSAQLHILIFGTECHTLRVPQKDLPRLLLVRERFHCVEQCRLLADMRTDVALANEFRCHCNE